LGANAVKPSSIYHALVAGVVWALTSPQRTQATSLPCAPTVCAASTAGARRSAWRTRLCGWKPLPGRDTVSRRFPSSLCVLREDMTCPGRPKCCRALLWTRGDAVSDSLTYCLSSNCSFPGLIGGPAARLPARIANTRPHHPHFSDSSSSLPALLTRALIILPSRIANTRPRARPVGACKPPRGGHRDAEERSSRHGAAQGRLNMGWNPPPSLCASHHASQDASRMSFVASALCPSH